MHKMSNKDLIENIIQIGLIVLLIILVTFMIQCVDSVQGNARVVNYAGVVRGATQRLVKLEVMNRPNNTLIENLDTILKNLENGGGEYHLNKLPDEEYLTKLTQQKILWEQLKQEIYKVREHGYENTNILKLSEDYFKMANDTVNSAENYSDEKAALLIMIEKILILIIVLIVLLLLKQTISAILLNRKNKELNKMAYIDANTGLPNKGKCDQLIFEYGILSNEEEYACIMFDLNNLKVVNDTFGHKAGDALILNFANILRRTTPEKLFLGRYGGDEFIAILFDTNEDEVKSVLMKIEINVQKFKDSESGSSISYAVGYEMSGGYKDCSLQILMDKADEKMYIDKMKKKKIKNR